MASQFIFNYLCRKIECGKSIHFSSSSTVVEDCTVIREIRVKSAYCCSKRNKKLFGNKNRTENALNSEKHSYGVKV